MTASIDSSFGSRLHRIAGRFVLEIAISVCGAIVAATILSASAPKPHAVVASAQERSNPPQSTNDRQIAAFGSSVALSHINQGQDEHTPHSDAAATPQMHATARHAHAHPVALAAMPPQRPHDGVVISTAAATASAEPAPASSALVLDPPHETRTAAAEKPRLMGRIAHVFAAPAWLVSQASGRVGEAGSKMIGFVSKL